MSKPGQSSPPKSSAQIDLRESTVRRAPKYGAFVLAGMWVGLASALAVALLFDPAPGQSRSTSAIYYCVLFGVLGSLLGACLVVFLDWRSHRRREGISLNHIHHHPEHADNRD